jgi:hypothetical protein
LQASPINFVKNKKCFIENSRDKTPSNIDKDILITNKSEVNNDLNTKKLTSSRNNCDNYNNHNTFTIISNDINHKYLNKGKSNYSKSPIITKNKTNISNLIIMKLN